MHDKLKRETLFVHAGFNFSDEHGSSALPINLSSTFKLKDPVNWQDGLIYSRHDNPTRMALERALAQAEGGRYGYAFSSGLAAIHSLLTFLKPGDAIVLDYDHYGGTFKQIYKVWQQLEIKPIYTDLRNPDNLRKALEENDNVKMVFFETPTNPMLRIIPIREISEITRQYGIISVVDNTFASPYLQNPLLEGADIVVHSLTKYIGGHSDIIGGAVITSNPEYAEQIKAFQKMTGAILSPLESYLALRGLRTLHVRMERHCYNAMKIARFLKEHPKVLKVNYPGLPDHPGHEIAKRQMKDFGGMISFEVDGDPVKFVQSTRVFTLAVSLGGVESLITSPSTTTHPEIPDFIKEAIGFRDNLIRISVGIENVEDLIEDLKQALEKL